MISQEDSATATPSLAERLKERRRVLTLQAEQAAEYYESMMEQAEREQWQGGDVVEY